MNTYRLFITTPILLILVFSCKSMTQEQQKFSEYYNRGVEQLVSGEKARGVTKAFADEIKRDANFNNFFQNTIPQESDERRRMCLYSIFYNYDITPSMKLVIVMLKDKVPAIRSMGLTYSRIHGYTKKLKDTIQNISQNDNNEFIRVKAHKVLSDI